MRSFLATLLVVEAGRKPDPYSESRYLHVAGGCSCIVKKGELDVSAVPDALALEERSVKSRDWLEACSE